MFMVWGSRIVISFVFKVIFALKNNSLWFLLGHITRWINVIYGSWMKWTWHHSKFAIHDLSFQHRLKVALIQLLSIHDGAVGMRDLDVMLLWFAPHLIIIKLDRWIMIFCLGLDHKTLACTVFIAMFLFFFWQKILIVYNFVHDRPQIRLEVRYLINRMLLLHLVLLGGSM